MLKQAFYILFFYFTGEFISSFIDGFIPGSVIGMILLFLALVFKLVKPANVKKLSTILTENMGLFFLPAGVGLMTSLGVILTWLHWPYIRKPASAFYIRY